MRSRGAPVSYSTESPSLRKAFFLTKLVRSWFASFEVRT